LNYRLHSGASRDLRDAAEYYRDRASPQIALEFYSEIEQAIGILLQHPSIGAPTAHGQRRFRVRRFPYSIIYHADDQAVFIVAVSHHRRKPVYWKDRV
jgi:toxin ParE1/3/4